MCITYGEVQVKANYISAWEASCGMGAGRGRGAEVTPSTERREFSPSSGVHGLLQTEQAVILAFYPLAMQSVVCRSAALALPGTLLELQNLRLPSPDLVNETTHFNNIPPWWCIQRLKFECPTHSARAGDRNEVAQALIPGNTCRCLWEDGTPHLVPKEMGAQSWQLAWLPHGTYYPPIHPPAPPSCCLHFPLTFP